MHGYFTNGESDVNCRLSPSFSHANIYVHKEIPLVWNNVYLHIDKYCKRRAEIGMDESGQTNPWLSNDHLIAFSRILDSMP